MFAPLIEKLWAKIIIRITTPVCFEHNFFLSDFYATFWGLTDLCESIFYDNGLYERIAGGWQHESLRVLSGAPAYDYLTSSYTSDEIWTLISNATNLKYIVGCGTPGTGDDSVRSTTGLAASHAYAILGTYKIKNSEGTIYNLI